MYELSLLSEDLLYFILKISLVKVEQVPQMKPMEALHDSLWNATKTGIRIKLLGKQKWNWRKEIFCSKRKGYIKLKYKKESRKMSKISVYFVEKQQNISAEQWKTSSKQISSRSKNSVHQRNQCGRYIRIAWTPTERKDTV